MPTTPIKPRHDYREQLKKRLFLSNNTGKIRRVAQFSPSKGQRIGLHNNF